MSMLKTMLARFHLQLSLPTELKDKENDHQEQHTRSRQMPTKYFKLVRREVATKGSNTLVDARIAESIGETRVFTQVLNQAKDNSDEHDDA